MQELAKAYAESAALISARLSELRRELSEATDPEVIWHIKHRISVLTPILTEQYALEEYCRRYYERGFFIGNGPFRGRGADQRRAEITRRAKNKNYNGHGVDRMSTGCVFRPYNER